MVAKRIGKNPLVLPSDDSAQGLVGFYFKITLIGIFMYVLANSFLPNLYDIFLPIKPFQSQGLIYLGIGLLIFSLMWTLIAQKDMKDSWRIGIDTEMKTKLITTGLFRISRNPTFLG